MTSTSAMPTWPLWCAAGTYVFAMLLLLVAFAVQLWCGRLSDYFRPRLTLFSALLGLLWAINCLAVLLLDQHCPPVLVHITPVLLAAGWLAVYSWRLSVLLALLRGWRRLMQHTLWLWETRHRMPLDRYLRSEKSLHCPTTRRVAGGLSLLAALVLGSAAFWQSPMDALPAVRITALDITCIVYAVAFGAVATWAGFQLDSSALLRVELVVMTVGGLACTGLAIGLRRWLERNTLVWPILFAGLHVLVALVYPMAHSPVYMRLPRPAASTDGWRAMIRNDHQWRAFAHFASRRGWSRHVEFAEMYRILVEATQVAFDDEDQVRVFDASLQWGLLCQEEMEKMSTQRDLDDNSMVAAVDLSCSSERGRVSQSQSNSMESTRRSSLFNTAISTSDIAATPQPAQSVTTLASSPSKLPTDPPGRDHHMRLLSHASSPSMSTSLERSLYELSASTAPPNHWTRPIPAFLRPPYLYFYARLIALSKSLDLTRHSVAEVMRRVSLDALTIDLFRECYAEVEWQLYQAIYMHIYAVRGCESAVADGVVRVPGQPPLSEDTLPLASHCPAALDMTSSMV